MKLKVVLLFVALALLIACTPVKPVAAEIEKISVTVVYEHLETGPYSTADHNCYYDWSGFQWPQRCYSSPFYATIYHKEGDSVKVTVAPLTAALFNLPSNGENIIINKSYCLDWFKIEKKWWQRNGKLVSVTKLDDLTVNTAYVAQLTKGCQGGYFYLEYKTGN